MDRFVRRPYELRFLFAALLVAALAVLFWTGSRYPALDEKAMMSGAIQLEDPLSFEARFALTEAMGTLERIFWSTLNWIDTNKKGMTFGVLFGAAFLTLAPFLRRRSFDGALPNAALGLAIGTPLGVCVNCAAPIARGLYSSGMRAETTLAAMVASPTLNVVVLTMAFSILPAYMAATKIALSLLVILVAIPLLCRLLPRTALPEEEVVCPLPLAPTAPAAPREGVLPALLGVARGFAANLWYIVRMTVPLMLLAGLLGATAATLLPQEAIVGLDYALWALVAIALVGLFLPVPIAFDVVVCGALLGAGLAQGYVMALLFTLGSFSVYSFLIVAQSVGRRAAWLMAGTVLALGVAAGAGVQAYHAWQQDRALELLLGGAGNDAPLLGAEGSVAVTSRPLAPPSPAGPTPFVRREAAEIGIDKPVEFSMRDMWPPFWEGRSLASGDIDRDGDIDLVVASTERGLYLYDNDGTGRFARLAPDLGSLADMHVFNAALADLDGDGFLDLLVATYLDGLHVWPNAGGAFGSEPPRPVPAASGAPLAMALSLADPDRDGDLDLALGNWAAGWYRRIPGEESRNRILWNDGGAFPEATDLPGIPGETLSILFTDMDDDGATDLIVGNDFDIPDYLYLGDGAGGFAMLGHEAGRIPHVTTTTMAVKTADLHNRGRSDIYLAQISGRSSGVSETLKMQPLDLYCDGIADGAARATCARNMAIKAWYRAGNAFDPSYAARCQEMAGRHAAECRAMLVKDLAIQRRDPSVCALIEAAQRVPRAYCDLHFLPARTPSEAEIAPTHPQILRSNVLLTPEGDGWTDAAEAQGLDIGGWSWDTKIADFDHDGLLDVYVVNGTWVPNEVSPSNLFFRNRGDGTFEEASGPFGLEDYLMTASATAFDMDGDGDLDMVTHPVNGPLVLFENTTQVRGLAIALRDGRGNGDAIGARLEMTDDAGTTQTRELQLGGGYMSFDAPRAHFAPAPGRTFETLSVRWPDGARTEHPGPWETGRHYVLTRG